MRDYLKNREFKHIEDPSCVYIYKGDSFVDGLPFFEAVGTEGFYMSHPLWRKLFIPLDGIPFPPEEPRIPVAYKQVKHLRVVK